MVRRDVPEVARLHYRLLPGLLTDLGPGVISYFYKTALEIPGTHGWVAADEQQRVVGFAFASERGADLYGQIFRRRPVQGIGCLAAGFFLKPVAFVRTAWWFLKGRPADLDFEAPELIYLAVDPAGRGGGSAAHLVKQAYESFRDKGSARLQLSVADDNVPVQRFFETLGAECVGTYEEGGIRRKRYAFRYENQTGQRPS